jgi:hypothetical protein
VLLSKCDHCQKCKRPTQDPHQILVISHKTLLWKFTLCGRGCPGLPEGGTETISTWGGKLLRLDVLSLTRYIICDTSQT